MAFPATTLLDSFIRGGEKPLSDGGKWVVGYTSLGVGEIRNERWWGEETYAFALWNHSYSEPAVVAEICGEFAPSHVAYLLACAPKEGEGYKAGYVLAAVKEGGANEWELTLQKNEGVLAAKVKAVKIFPGDKIGLWVHEGTVSSWVNHEGVWREIQSVADGTFTEGYSGIGGEMAGAEAAVGLRNFEVSGPPILTNPGTKHNHVGDTVAYQVIATGTETYEATGLPAGLAINAGTGKITGKPTTVEEPMVTLTVKGPGGEATAEFKWVIEPELVGGVNATGMIL